jgi:hypothetical protein
MTTEEGVNDDVGEESEEDFDDVISTEARVAKLELELAFVRTALSRSQLSEGPTLGLL